MSAASIQAWKPAAFDASHITPCEFDDEAATLFEVKFAGAYCGMPLRLESKHLAEEVCRALVRCHEAGGEAKLRELRRFLGI